MGCLLTMDWVDMNLEELSRKYTSGYDDKCEPASAVMEILNMHNLREGVLKFSCCMREQ